MGSTWRAQRVGTGVEEHRQELHGEVWEYGEWGRGGVRSMGGVGGAPVPGEGPPQLGRNALPVPAGCHRGLAAAPLHPCASPNIAPTSCHPNTSAPSLVPSPLTFSSEGFVGVGIFLESVFSEALLDLLTVPGRWRGGLKPRESPIPTLASPCTTSCSGALVDPSSKVLGTPHGSSAQAGLWGQSQRMDSACPHNGQ